MGMRMLRLLLIVAISGSGTAAAEEHVACRNLDLVSQRAPADFRRIADSCADGVIAHLYYQRAHHAELVMEAEALSALTTIYPAYEGEAFHAHRIYLVLIEEFARSWFPDTRERALFLGEQYERLSHIAELRLRGHDAVADNLEGRRQRQ